MKQTIISIKFIIITIITLFCWQWFNYRDFSNSFVKSGTFLIVFSLVIYALPVLFNYKRVNNEFYKPIKYILFVSCLAILNAYFFYGQTVVESYRVMATGLLQYILFLALLRLNPTIHHVEAWILCFASLYCLLWLYGFSQIPTIVFGYHGNDIELEERGIYRLMFTGSTSLTLAAFLSLNKYVVYKRRIFLLLTFIFYLFLMLQLTRQTIIFSFIVGIVYYYRNRKKTIIFLTGLILMVSYFIDFSHILDNTILGNLVELTNKQIESQSAGDEYIRISEYRYFFTEWHTNILTMLTGTGMPHSESNFGQWYLGLQQKQLYYLSDVGYAMMYAVLGIGGLCLFIFIFIKGIRIKICKQYQYAKMFIWAMILYNIAASWFSTPDCIFCTCFCLYIIGNKKNQLE